MANGRLVWELLGAAVGAGLASGREIASFFAESGPWSWVGIALSTAVMALLLPASMDERWRGRWPDRLWRLLQTLLLIVTGGAMLAAAGEVAALTLPVQGAYWLGLAGTFLLGWWLAFRTDDGLAWVSRTLLAGMALLLLFGLEGPPMRAVQLEARSPAESLLRAVAYGGFNAAIMRPVAETSGAGGSSGKTPRWLACAGFGFLIALGNAVLLRNPALLAEPMPFVKLAGQLGRGGYLLSASCLYLAVLSTLTACLRALGRRALPAGGLLAAALMGFTGVVGAAYPALGGFSAVMMALMRLCHGGSNFRNSARKAFHSPRDML